MNEQIMDTLSVVDTIKKLSDDIYILKADIYNLIDREAQARNAIIEHLDEFRLQMNSIRDRLYIIETIVLTKDNK